MNTDLQRAWKEYCETNVKRVDRDSFIAGWTACQSYAGRSLDELAFIGRQIARGVPRQQVEVELRQPVRIAA